MPDFTYKISSGGKVESGSISASDRKTALSKLSRGGKTVLELKSADASNSVSASAAAAEVKGGEELALAFFKKMMQLCKGGMPIADALRGLAQRSLNKNMQALARDLYKNISEGATLASAMSAFPKLFEPSILNLADAGESTANIVPIFQNIIKYLEGKKALRASVVSALVYPIILCALASGVVLLFLFYLLPMIQNMMSNLGGEINLPVKILIVFGDVLMFGLPVAVVVFFALAVFISRWRATESGRLASDRILLKIPLAGKIIYNADLGRVTNLISTLYASGVNTTETLKMAERTIGNSYLRLRFQQCRLAINDGAAVAASFKKYAIFDDDDIDILSVGERTGSLVECFAEIYNLHMETLASSIKRATSILTAVAFITAVVIIFLVALGIVSSVYGLSQTLSS
ncbi:MAG: type II secretion system F family protein [Opitutales bacterium]|nr:type II secretion system F family protein [Opitutales bacterium]